MQTRHIRTFHIEIEGQQCKKELRCYLAESPNGFGENQNLTEKGNEFAKPRFCCVVKNIKKSGFQAKKGEKKVVVTAQKIFQTKGRKTLCHSVFALESSNASVML